MLGERRSYDIFKLKWKFFCLDYYIMENGTFLLRRIDERDFGMYICIVRNNVGIVMV